MGGARFSGGRRQELGYAELTSDFQTTSTSVTAVTGLALSGLAIPADRPVEVKAWVSALQNSGAGNSVTLRLLDGSAAVSYGDVQPTISTAGGRTPPISIERRFLAGSAPTSFAVYIKTSAGTATLGAVAGVWLPAFIRVDAL